MRFTTHANEIRQPQSKTCARHRAARGGPVRSRSRGRPVCVRAGVRAWRGGRGRGGAQQSQANMSVDIVHAGVLTTENWNTPCSGLPRRPRTADGAPNSIPRPSPTHTHEHKHTHTHTHTHTRAHSHTHARTNTHTHTHTHQHACTHARTDEAVTPNAQRPTSLKMGLSSAVHACPAIHATLR